MKATGYSTTRGDQRNAMLNMRNHCSRTLIKMEDATGSWEMIWGFQMSVRSSENGRRGSLLRLLPVYLWIRKHTVGIQKQALAAPVSTVINSCIQYQEIYGWIKQNSIKIQRIYLKNSKDGNMDIPSCWARPDHKKGLKCSWHGQTNENLVMYFIQCLVWYF